MLVDYKNDLFATHETMNSALRYVSVLCGAAASSSDSIAIRTGAAVLLNTAIELHRAEKQVLINKINEMSARSNPVNALLTLVQEQVAKALAEQDVSEKIDTWMADNLLEAIDSRSNIKDLVAEQIDSWMRDNLADKMDEHVDIEDIVNDKVSDYFSNNSFSIQPN